MTETEGSLEVLKENLVTKEGDAVSEKLMKQVEVFV